MADLIEPVTEDDVEDWAGEFADAVTTALVAMVREFADELGADDVLLAAGPDDAERLRTRWRDRVRRGRDALAGFVWRAFGRTARHTRDAVVDVLPEPAGAPPDWRDMLTAGPMAAPLVDPDTAEPVVQQTADALDRLGADVAVWVRDQIAEGMAAGETVDEVADRLRDGIEDMATWRARRIARTEMTRTANDASLAEMLALGVAATKTWETQRDDRVRHAHAEADEDTVPVGETFTVGGFPMRYPGDPRAPAELVCNCRCLLRYALTPGPLPDWAEAAAVGAGPTTTPGSERADEWPEFTGWDTNLGGVTAAMTNDTTTTAAADVADDGAELQSGMPPQLKEYWLHGEGAAKVRWGTPGAFDRCVSAMREENVPSPEGTCANLHHEATGKWPGEDRDEDTADVLTAAADVHTGAMVALVPSDADIARLAVDGGEPADQLHLTVLYLGKADAIPDEARTNLVDELRAWADGDGETIQAHGFAVNLFNPGGDEPCIVLGIGGDDLAEAGQRIRAVTRNVLGIDGVDVPDQHEPWVPHTTLLYLPDATPAELGARVGELADRTGPITLDRIRVAFAGDVTDIPLPATDDGDGDEEDDMPDDDETPETETEVTAAALDLMEAPAPVDVAAPPAAPGAWEGVLTVEGRPTGDGREFAARALTAAPLPMPLMRQYQTADGHDGSVVVARIDEVWRDGNEIWGRGVFDLAMAEARDAARQARDGFARGVSVDVDDITDADVEFVWAESVDEDGDLVTYLDRRVFRRGRIRGATLVSIPAFVEAGIQLGWTRSPTEDRLAPADMPAAEPLALIACACGGTTAATAAGAPPAEWFADPGLTGPTPLTVTDDGRVYGHGALWGTCHVGIAGQCVTPPREGDHAYYRLGEVVCADGSAVPAGHITIGTGHASTAGIDPRAAAEHYDNTGTAVADVASGEDAFGIWVSGALRPGVHPDRVRELRGAQLSGDWRRIAGKLRLVAMLAVNVPGFPVPRLATASAEGRQTALVAAGLVDRDALAARVDELVARLGIASLGERVEALAARIGRDHGSRVAAMAARIERNGDGVWVPEPAEDAGDVARGRRAGAGAAGRGEGRGGSGHGGGGAGVRAA